MVYLSIEFGLGHKSADKPRAPRTDGMAFVCSEADAARADARHRTADNYLTAARSLSLFMGGETWHFSDLTPRLLADYQRWLCSRGLCMNTVSVYMRSLRTLYNRMAASRGTRSPSPFVAVYTGRAPTAKRSVSEDELRRLNGLALRAGSSLARARDLFMFSFYAMGMPFVDIAYLRKAQVSGGVLRYVRRKTAREICVAVVPRMAEIMERYARPDSDFVFPMLCGVAPADLHRAYLASLRSHNYLLRRLSSMAGLARPLSSYVARHSWASMAYAHDFDLRLISQAMGHTKPSTTLIYIRSLLAPSVAEANGRMLRELGLE